MADTPAPKRDSREPTPGAPGLSSAEFEKMMEELEAGIKKARSTRAPLTQPPLTTESALEKVKSEGITDARGALRRAAAIRSEERTNEERRRKAQEQIRRSQAPPMREKSE